ncbi:MAG: hypothetical protein R2813_01100 [Flavobacteriales bacterium]
MSKLRMRTYLKLVLVFSIAITVGCRRELEPPEVENELLTPILRTSLDISKIVPDSLRSEADDGLISLVYRTTLYESTLDIFDELTTKQFENVAKLDSLKLDDRIVENHITLGQIAENDQVYGPTIIALNGQTVPIPAISNLSFGPNVLDGSEFFDEMTLDTGYMTISISNGFPSSISDIDFSIVNQTAQNAIVQDTFSKIYPNQTRSKTYDLDQDPRVVVESFLEAWVDNFNLDASSGPVLIDTSDRITVKITIGDLRVYAAVAVFPQQNIINTGDINAMQQVSNSRIIKAVAKKGFVNVEVVSTVEDELYFYYNIPEGLYNGSPFDINETIPAAPSSNKPSKKSFKYDVSGYEFGMTGYPIKDSFNVFYSELRGEIQYTGKKRNITLEDSIRIFVHLSGFIPEYMEGYAGDTTISVGPSIAKLSLFDKLSAKSLSFEQVKMSVGISNGNNVPFKIAIHEIKAKNTKTGKSVSIDLGSVDNPISVSGASSIFEPWENSWSFENATANLNNVLSIFPDQFETSMTIEINPDKDTNDLTQFAVDSNKLSAYADIEIPLSFIADELTLIDTVEFSSANISSPEGIGSGTLYAIVDNSFPLRAEIELMFLDAGGNRLQQVTFDEEVAAGKLNNPTETVLAWSFDRNSFDNVLSASHVIMKASVSTVSTSTPVKIYSTMDLDVKLSARFNYLYGGKKK